MNVHFLMGEEFEQVAEKETTYDGDLYKTKALCLSVSERILVNLGAEQWIFYNDMFGQDNLLSQMYKTLHHEGLHVAFLYVGIDTKFDVGEERVCRSLAGQL